MIDPGVVLLLSVVVPGAAMLAFFGATRGLPTGARRYGLVVAAMTASLTGMYLLMGSVTYTTGNEPAIVRFIGHTLLWTGIVVVVSSVAGVGRRLSLGLFAMCLTQIWAMPVGWYAQGLLATVATVATVAAVIVGLGLLFGPITSVAQTRSAERSLLFNKLKHLIAISWTALVGSGFISQDSLGLADPFVGQVLAIYLEVLFIVGFAGITLRSPAALEETAADSSGLFSFLRRGHAETARTGDDAEAATTAD